MRLYKREQHESGERVIWTWDVGWSSQEVNLDKLKVINLNKSKELLNIL